MQQVRSLLRRTGGVAILPIGSTGVNSESFREKGKGTTPGGGKERVDSFVVMVGVGCYFLEARGWFSFRHARGGDGWGERGGVPISPFVGEPLEDGVRCGELIKADGESALDKVSLEFQRRDG